MREFFQGWRRKVGCVALVLAAAFAVAWFRSQLYWDLVAVPFRRVVYSLDSDNGALAFERAWHTNEDIIEWCTLGWKTDESRYGHPPHGLYEFQDVHWNYLDGKIHCQAIVISHLSISLPLSLLSAYLLLWKPRKRTGAEHA